MKAIQVKYLPTTEHRGTRLKAWVEGFAITRSRDYDLDTADQARAVAMELAKTLDWLEEDVYLQGGTLPNGDYCFIPCVEPRVA